MICNFSGKKGVSREKIRLDDQEIPQKQHFKYLGSIINHDEEMRMMLIIE